MESADKEPELPDFKSISISNTERFWHILSLSTGVFWMGTLIRRCANLSDGWLDFFIFLPVFLVFGSMIGSNLIQIWYAEEHLIDVKKKEMFSSYLKSVKDFYLNKKEKKE